jgi:hypothetical protein
MKIGIFVLTGTLALSIFPNYSFAWSSRGDIPIFEAVHQMAVEKVLSGMVDAQFIDILQEQQLVVDQDKGIKYSQEHAMTGLAPGEKYDDRKPVFVVRSNAFVISKLTEAKHFRQQGNIPESMEQLGKAIHTLQDSTSPAHQGFQPWHDDESLISKTQHVLKEATYPDDGGSTRELQRKKLEGATLWAYDIFIGKTSMPSEFFDAKSGMILLPSEYMEAVK